VSDGRLETVTLEILMQNIANGITLGSLYALLAIGYTMVYGILRLINFAHGEIFMISTYFAFYGIAIFALPWQLSFVMAIVLTALLGVVIERAAYRPLRDAPRISALISAIGVSFLMANLGLVIFGGRPKTFFRPQLFQIPIQLGRIRVVALFFIIPVLTVVLLAILNYIVYKTKIGLAMRAAQWDFDVARLMGIEVDRAISVTFAIGSALAAIGGIMWGLRFVEINPNMGLFPGLKCFIAAVFGGIGNIAGAVLGGFLLGFGEIMLVAFLPGLAGYRDAFAFVLLILMLLFRPTGLLGEKQRVRT
jgi:branched-chain amino acid transport system permease protein